MKLKVILVSKTTRALNTRLKKHSVHLTPVMSRKKMIMKLQVRRRMKYTMVRVNRMKLVVKNRILRMTPLRNVAQLVYVQRAVALAAA